jgi:mannose-6-phosphate isomerase-like protein (cupin superfamily)
MNQVQNIIQKAKDNDYFRQVLLTGKHTQAVLMSIPADGQIGDEVHQDNDQLFLFIQGSAHVFIDGALLKTQAGDAVLVPAGAQHNVVNHGGEPLKLITTYSPPHHPQGTIHKTKAEADAAE